VALPALMRADKLGKRAARVGFDWPDRAGPLAKISEELAELTEAVRQDNAAHEAEEFGDLLFAVANLARHLGLDPEEALASANRKFEARFRDMETSIHALGLDMAALDLDTLEQYWQQAKLRER
jgi:nucleoside triphosphate diphosphatase